MKEFLPEPLPADPLPLLAQWFAQATQQRLQNNPDAMTLATVDADGRPSARIVLCKQLVVAAGYLVFFSNYHSRKGQALAAHPYAAAVFHWDAQERQARVEGRVLRSPEAESDVYFHSRPLLSQLGAWASEQSQPLAARAQLDEQLAQVQARFGIHDLEQPQQTVPRPPHWGGYRLWIEHVELWIAAPGRVHDRARWSRELQPVNEGFQGGAWHSSRLNP